MSNNEIAKRFSKTLASIMCEQGHISSRGKNRIDIKALSSMAGCSYQMARKYALGLVLPELAIIEKIAQHLNCHPSVLLFEERPVFVSKTLNKAENILEINKDTLKYILSKSFKLLSAPHNPQDIVNFIVEMVYDAAHLDVNQKTLYKIIDMMISSATLLNNTNQDDNHASIRL